MKDLLPSDINRGYVKFINIITRENKRYFSVSWLLSTLINLLRILSLPLLFIYGLVLVLVLSVRMAFVKKEIGVLHRRALACAQDFIQQYPLHLYPVVAKSLELSFLKEYLPQYINVAPQSVVEMAIGDGSLSKRIFSERDKVVGFDLNPYSLVHTTKLSHVTRRVVSDCMNPPLLHNSAYLLVSNNFLHHVSQKELVMGNWAEIASVAVFNENTPYWASGWTVPFLLKTIGLFELSKKESDSLAKRSLQTLLPLEDLRKKVNNHFEILKEVTFMSEKTFFLCSFFSLFLWCYGPPTPRLPKLIFNNFLKPFAHGLTSLIARLLIQYDFLQSRDRDVYVFWVCKSKKCASSVRSEPTLVCPDCNVTLCKNECSRCGWKFLEQGGMMFLVPKTLRDSVVFDATKAQCLGAEHL
jgi:hypothetical protein